MLLSVSGFGQFSISARPQKDQQINTNNFFSKSGVVQLPNDISGAGTTYYSIGYNTIEGYDEPISYGHVYCNGEGLRIPIVFTGPSNKNYYSTSPFDGRLDFVGASFLHIHTRNGITDTTIFRPNQPPGSFSGPDSAFFLVDRTPGNVGVDYGDVSNHPLSTENNAFFLNEYDHILLNNNVGAYYDNIDFISARGANINNEGNLFFAIEIPNVDNFGGYHAEENTIYGLRPGDKILIYTFFETVPLADEILHGRSSNIDSLIIPVEHVGDYTPTYVDNNKDKLFLNIQISYLHKSINDFLLCGVNDSLKISIDSTLAFPRLGTYTFTPEWKRAVTVTDDLGAALGTYTSVVSSPIRDSLVLYSSDIPNDKDSTLSRYSFSINYQNSYTCPIDNLSDVLQLPTNSFSSVVGIGIKNNYAARRDVLSSSSAPKRLDVGSDLNRYNVYSPDNFIYLLGHSFNINAKDSILCIDGSDMIIPLETDFTDLGIEQLTYQWYNGSTAIVGAVSNSLQRNLNDADALWLEVAAPSAYTSTLRCVSRSDTVLAFRATDPIFTTTRSDNNLVRLVVPQDFSIQASDSELCDTISSTTFYVKSLAGDTSIYQYQWYKNGVAQGTLSSSATYVGDVKSGDSVYVSVTVVNTASNVICSGISKKAYVRSNTDNYFALNNSGLGSDGYYIRIWDSIRPHLQVSGNDLCTTNTIDINLNRYNVGSSATATVNRFWYRIHPTFGVSGFSDGGETGLPAVVGSRVYVVSTPSVLSSCSVNSDTVKIRSFDDAVFTAGVIPNDTLVRVNDISPFYIKAADSIMCYDGTVSTTTNLFSTSEQFEARSQYQWYNGSTPIAGAIQNTYDSTLSSEDSIHMVVSIPGGCSRFSDTILARRSTDVTFNTARADSNLIRLLVTEEDFSIQPSDSELCDTTSSTTFYVKSLAGDTSIYQYQWYKNGVAQGILSSSATYVGDVKSGDSVYVSVTVVNTASNVICSGISKKAYVRSNTDSYFALNSSGLGSDGYYIRIWDSVAGNLSSSTTEICIGQPLAIMLSNYNAGEGLSTNVTRQWYNNGFPLIGETGTSLSTSTGVFTGNDSIYLLTMIDPATLPSCIFSSDTVTVYNNNNSYFNSRAGTNQVVRYNSVIPKVKTVDSNLCVGGTASIEFNYLGTGTASDYDYTWYNKSNSIVGGSPTLFHDAQIGDSISSKLTLKTARIGVGATACVLESDTLRVKGNTDVLFKTQRADTNLIRVWNDFGAEIKALDSNLCIIPVSRNENTYSIDKYLNVQASQVSLQWYLNGNLEVGKQSSTYLKTTNNTNDTIHLVTILKNSAKCTSSSDSIFIRSNKNSIFNSNSPSKKRVRIYDTTDIDIQFNPNASGGYEFCFGLINTAKVEKNTGDFVSYTWYKKKSTTPATQLNNSVLSTIDLKQLVPRDSIWTVGINSSSCTAVSDTITVDSVTSGRTASSELIQITFDVNFATLAARSDEFCTASGLILDVTSGTSSVFAYEWNYKRNNSLYRIPTPATAINVDSIIFSGFQAGDKIWATLTNSLGCQTTTDTVTIYSKSDPDKPTQSNKNVYIIDNFPFTATANKIEICAGDNLILQANVPPNYESPIHGYKWNMLSNTGTVTTLGQGTTLNTYTLSNIDTLNNSGNYYWAEVSVTVTGGLVCQVPSDTIRIASDITPASASSENVAFYSTVTATNQADVPAVCLSNTLLFTLSNLVGNANRYQWKKIDVNGTTTIISGATASSLTETDVKHGDSIWCELTSSAGCGGNSDTVRILNTLSALNRNKQNVRIYDTVSGSISANKDEFCHDETVSISLTEIKGDANEYTFLSSNSQIPSQSGINTDRIYFASNFNQGDYMWVRLKNTVGCTGRSDTIVFNNGATGKTTKKPWVKENLIGSITSPSNSKTYCPANPIDFALSFTSGYDQDTTSIRWYKFKDDNSQLLTAGQGSVNLRLIANRDVELGDIIYATFSDKASPSCRFISDSITFVASNSSLKKWEIISLPSVNVQATVTRFCAGNDLTINLNGLPPNANRYFWLRRDAATATISRPQPDTLSSQYVAANLQNGDAVWARVKTNIAGCDLATDTLIVSNSVQAPTNKDVLIYDSVSADIKVNQTIKEFCLGDGIPLSAFNFTGDINNVTWSKVKGTVTSRLFVDSRTLPYTSDLSYVLPGNQISVGDTVFATLTNATGCISYTDSIVAQSNTSVLANSKNFMIYDKILASVEANLTDICIGGTVSFDVNLLPTSNVNNSDQAQLSRYKWIRRRQNANQTIDTNSTSTSSDLINGDFVFAELTNNLGCVATSLDSVKFSYTTTNPAVRDVLIHNLSAEATADQSVFCAGASVQFSLQNIVFPSTSSIVSYKWYLKRGNRTTVLSTSTLSAVSSTNTLKNLDSVWCVFTDALGCSASSDTIAVTNVGQPSRTLLVIKDVSGLTLSAGVNDVCKNTSVRYSVETTPQGTPNILFKWYTRQSNGIENQIAGASSSALNYRLNSGDIIWVEYQQGCATYRTDTVYLISNTVTKNTSRKEVVIYDSIIVDLEPRVNNTPTSNFCVGDNVQFSLNIKTPNVSLGSYKWYKNGIRINGAVSSTYTANNFTNGDRIYCQTDTKSPPMPVLCAVRSSEIKILNKLNISNPQKNDELRILDYAKAKISTSVSEFCSGSAVQFMLTQDFNSDSIQQYRWMLNGKQLATKSISSQTSINFLKNGDRIWCELFNERDCIYYSDTITVINTNVVVAGTIRIYDLKTTSISYPVGICVGQQADFKVSLSNRNITSYSWIKNSNVVGNAPALSLNDLQNGDTVYVRLQEFNCSIFNSDTAYVISSVNSSSLVRKKVTIYDDINAVVNYADKTVCSDENHLFSLENLSSGITSYQWMKKRGPVVENAVSNQKYVVSGLQEKDTIYALLTHGLLGCTGQSNKISVVRNRVSLSNAIVSVYDRPNYNIIPSGLTSQTTREFCEGDNIQFSLSKVSGNATNTFQWTKNSQSLFGENGALYSNNKLGVGDVISAIITNSACEVRADGVTVTALPISAQDNSKIRIRIINTDVVIPSDNILCGNDLIVFEALNYGTGIFTFVWNKNGSVVGENNPSYTDPGLKHKDAIYVDMTNDIGCFARSNVINLIVGRAPKKDEIWIASTTEVRADIAPGQSVYCLNSSIIDISVTNLSAGKVDFYQWYKNGILVSTDNLYQGKVYYGDKISALVTLTTGCIAESDTVVVVQELAKTSNEVQLLEFNLKPDNHTAINEFCGDSRVFFSLINLPTTSREDYSYRWKINNQIIGSEPLLMVSNLNPGDQVWCEVVNFIGCRVNSDTITVVTQQVPSSNQVLARTDCQITTGSFLDTLDPGDVIMINYTSELISALQTADKGYEVQLSDPYGSFDNPLVLGSSIQKNLSGTLSARIPLDVPSGCKYRIRVVIRGLDITSYFPNDKDITIVSTLDLNNYTFGYVPNTSKLIEAQVGSSTLPIVDRRGCEMSFELVTPSVQGVSIDPTTGVLSWDNTILFEDQEVLVRLITPFDQNKGTEFVTNYNFVAELEKYNFQVYPNPVKASRPLVRAGFQLTRESNVNIKIIDESGKLVGVFFEKANMQKGNYVEFINIYSLPNGIYILLLEVDGNTTAKQFMITP